MGATRYLVSKDRRFRVKDLRMSYIAQIKKEGVSAIVSNQLGINVPE